MNSLSTNWQKLRPNFSKTLNELLLGSLGLAAATLWLCEPLRQSADMWMHLAVGRYLVESRFIPRTDVFSWTAAGHLWTNHEWFYDVTVYSFYKSGGLNGLTFLKVLLLDFVLLIQWFRLKDWNVGPIFRCIVLTFILCAGRYDWPLRADFTSLCFLSILLWVLETWRESQAICRIAFLTGLFALWANTHGGFLAGLTVVFLFAAGAVAQNSSSKKSLLLCLGFCAAATLLNPYGIRLHLSLIHGAAILKNSSISEWRRTPWHYREAFWCGLFLFWTIFFCRFRPQEWPREFRTPEFWLALFFTWGAVRFQRNVPLFMVCAFPYASKWLMELERVQVFWKRKSPQTVSRILGWLVIASLAAFSVNATRKLGKPPTDDRLPIEACRFLDAIPLSRFYNEYNFGSYWMWHFGPARPDFIDSRFHAVAGFPALDAQILLALKQGPGAWRQLMDANSVEGALLQYNAMKGFAAPAEAYFPKNQWALVYWDDTAMIFLKRLDRFQPIIKAHEFHFVEPDSDTAYFQRRALQSPQTAAALRLELERNLRLHPGSRRTFELLNALPPNTGLHSLYREQAAKN